MEWFAAPEYSFARLLISRGLGAVYLVAFLVAAMQFRPLLGERGLMPVPRFLRLVTFRHAPSVFHWRYSDALALTVAWSGVVLSTLVVVGVVDRLPVGAAFLVWALLWALYLSIVNVGQTWYGFGWESLLLEAGFLGIFLGPSHLAPAAPLIWLFRWLLFRVEFGAGLIKLRGDRCWRDLTCLYYHHETQPMPNRFSWYFHHLPKSLHKVEVVANYFAQLVAPVLIFLPQPVASAGGLVVIVTQSWLVTSGNFSWLNWVTIVLGFSALDNSTLEAVLPFDAPAVPSSSPTWYVVAVMGLVAMVVVLSRWPVRNLISSSQAMNRSFNNLHLVNTYGAFGSVTRVRHEVVIEGTSSQDVSADSEWREYEFKGKPGDPKRRPRQFAPYHLRLDWLMWFAGISSAYADPWLYNLLGKLLDGDRAVLKLLRVNPFGDSPPTAVRALLYRYRFSTWQERRRDKVWWVRELVGEYVPPVSLR